jgi:hypothetical protein
MIKINENSTNKAMESNESNETSETRSKIGSETNSNLVKYQISNYMNNPGITFKKTLSFLKFFIKNFLKFYTIRALLELMKKFLKNQFKIFKYPLSKFLNIFFNSDNFRTGLFLTIMPGLYKIFSSVFEKYFAKGNTEKDADSESNFGDRYEKMLYTFLSGFMAGFVGIFFAEKADIMNFIILSIMIRCLHSLIVVYLKKKGYPTQSRLVAFLAFTLACFGVLFLFFYHPSYKPMTKLVDRFALYHGNEKAEFNYFKTLVA